MSEIRIQKIDGVEFVTYKDYQKLKEEVKDLVERNVELDKKYMIVLTENKNLKERIAELEKCNLNLQGQIDKQNRGYEPQFENGFPKYNLNRKQ